jgi:hypothetical protein
MPVTEMQIMNRERLPTKRLNAALLMKSSCPLFHDFSPMLFLGYTFVSMNLGGGQSHKTYHHRIPGTHVKRLLLEP